MNVWQALLVALVSALLSGALTGLIAVIKMQNGLTELKTIVKSTVEFRLGALEAAVAVLMRRDADKS